MALALLLIWLLRLLQWALIIHVLLSWVRLPPDNPIVAALNVVCEPLLAPIRQVIPPMAGLDFTPLVVLFILDVLKRIVIGAVV